MFTCFYCGKSLDDSMRSLEHIVPESIGGNITTWMVCKDCNTRANQEIDEKFKDQWLISWDRAFLGLSDKRGKKHIEVIETSRENGEKIQIRVGEDGLVPITKPDSNIDWEKGHAIIKTDPKYQDKILNDLKKKAVKKGVNFDYTTMSEQYVSEEVGTVKFSKGIDLKVFRREQVKIILGLSCFFIPNFTNSKTAIALRNYLWNINGSETVKNLQAKLFPFEITDKNLPSFTIDKNVILTYPNEGMEIEVILRSLKIDREHIFAVYEHKGKLRLFLSIFGHINALVDTIERPTHFFLGPVPFKDTAYVIDPKNKKHKKIEIDNIINLVPSLASTKLAGFLSSKPGLFNSIAKG